MSLRQLQFSVGEDRSYIELIAILTEDGLSVTLTGGEKPHIGGIAICYPGDEQKEFKTHELSIPGHKDVIAARLVAEQIAFSCSEKVVVVAGIHIDNASKEEIDVLLRNCKTAASQLQEQLNNLKKRETNA